MPRSAEQINVLDKELRQARILVARGSTVYLLLFFKIDAHLTRHEFTRKLSGYIKRKGYTGGVILAYFSQSGEFHQWTEKELGQKKSGSCDPAAIRGKSDKPKCPR